MVSAKRPKVKRATRAQMTALLKKNLEDRLAVCREEAIVQMVDKQMAPIIKDLREAGLETFTCCEGGPGHSWRTPIVRVNRKHSKRQIFKALQDAGYSGFEVSEVFKQDQSRYFWHIDFCVIEPKPGVYLTNHNQPGPEEVLALKHRLYELLCLTDQLRGVNCEA